MRTLALAALTMVTALGVTQAAAQGPGGRLGPGPGAPYPAPGMQQPGSAPVNMPPRPYPGPAYPGPHPAPGGGWQGGGHWSGGMNAPGGWNAYRRPSRGYRLPSYWTSPDFFIGDFGGYGLYAPPQGYGWQRYYDDAVLVDPRGRVSDAMYGVDWDHGHSYDRGYDRGYDGGYAYPPQYQPLPPVVQNGTVTTYSTSSGYGGGYGGGYYYPGATTTVVTIQGAPIVSTTTTEYVEETTTHYVAPRRVYRAKRHYYRPARCSCRRAAPVDKPILGS